MIQLTYVFPEMSERELRRLIGEIENELGIVPNQIVVNDRCVNYDELEFVEEEYPELKGGEA